ncbi:MAG: PH domain-containing protein [Pseudonocardia sp.]
MAFPPDPTSPRAVFQIPRLTVLFAVTLTICVTPVAFAAPWLWLIYLIPLGIIAWVLRVRTTVDPEAVTVRGLLRTRRVPWTQISSLRLGRSVLRDRSGVRAVLTDGGELPLPAVHVRDLPQLAAVSGGRLPDPAGE